MSTRSVLDSVLRDVIVARQPLRQDCEVRERVINELKAVVETIESLQGAAVEPFGSYVSNLFTRSGDLDISIELKNGSYIATAGKKQKLKLLAEITNALRMAGGWRKMQFIPHARVPILKLESKYRNISCDISINNLKGLIKSRILFWISGMDGRFRELVIVVKEWAKAHAINNSKTGSLNSYSLTLLVIFHFQTCQPAILPPLEEIYPANVVDELSGVRHAVEKRIEEICANNIARFISHRQRSLNRSSLSDLFISFLAKFSDIGLRAIEQGICPFTGQWIDIETNMRWQPRTYALFIEDPFEQPENAARAVSERQLTKISGLFQSSHRELVAPNQNRSFLMTTLFRPQITNVWPTVRRPSASTGSHVTPRKQINGPASSLKQTHGEFHNMSLEDRANNKQINGPAYSPTQTCAEFHNTSLENRYNNKQINGPASLPTQKRADFHNMSLENRPNNKSKPRPARAPQAQPQKVWRPRSEK